MLSREVFAAIEAAKASRVGAIDGRRYRHLGAPFSNFILIDDRGLFRIARAWRSVALENGDFKPMEVFTPAPIALASNEDLLEVFFRVNAELEVPLMSREIYEEMRLAESVSDGSATRSVGSMISREKIAWIKGTEDAFLEGFTKLILGFCLHHELKIVRFVHSATIRAKILWKEASIDPIVEGNVSKSLHPYDLLNAPELGHTTTLYAFQAMLKRADALFEANLPYGGYIQGEMPGGAWSCPEFFSWYPVSKGVAVARPEDFLSPFRENGGSVYQGRCDFEVECNIQQCSDHEKLEAVEFYQKIRRF